MSDNPQSDPPIVSTDSWQLRQEQSVNVGMLRHKRLRLVLSQAALDLTQGSHGILRPKMLKGLTWERRPPALKAR